MRSIVFALSAVISLCRCCGAEVSLPVVLDFEPGSVEPYVLDGARITDAPGFVLSGSRSVLADSRSSGDEWHEFFRTSPDVRFEPEHAYLITFDYRILDSGKPETRFYSLLRSRSGGDIYGWFWLWNRESGAEGTIRRLFRIEEKDDWMLIIGVRHRGAILIDRVSISRAESEPPGWGLPVKPGSTDIVRTGAELDALRRREGLDELTADMLIIWCNEGAGAKIIDARERFAEEHQPDFVDWNPCGPLARDFGVRTSSGGPEYQEFYRFEGPDLWDGRYQRFVDNGFAASLDGTTIRDETWGEGGYFTCHNGKGWHRWFTDRLLAMTADRLAVCQDNIACAPFLKGYGCFCGPCLAGFRSWLKSRYAADELAAFGITDIESFDYAEPATRHGLIGNRALSDPVTREYIKYQYCSHLGAWGRVVAAVKDDSKRRGYPVPCYGNQIGAAGWWPYAIAIGLLCDVIEIEDVFGVRDRIPNRSLQYKMGRASGHESKPVWVRGPVYDEKKERAPELSPLFWQTHLAEALANGGARTISFGINAPWTGDPDTLDFIDSPQVRDVWKQYAELCRANRAVFTRRESLAKVALVYSLPSTMYRRFYPLQIDDNSVFGAFESAARLLDENHVPYDCVVFGHPEVFPTQMSRLARYDTLVIPAADALTDTQVSFLQKFASKGGKIVSGGPLGIFDADLNKRTGENPLSCVHPVDLDEDRDSAVRLLRGASAVVVDAPSNVTANLWMSAGGASVDLHLVNYDADLAAGVRREAGPLNARVNLPDGFRFDCVRLLRYGHPPTDLEFARTEGSVSVVVPEFGSYAVVSFADRAKLDAANAAAERRRAADREHVMRLAAEKGLY